MFIRTKASWSRRRWGAARTPSRAFYIAARHGFCASRRSLRATLPSARRGAQDHVAIAFKKTTPLDGPDLSRMRYINYSELTIVPLDPLDSEPSVRMGPGGVVLDEEAEGCSGEDCCVRCGTGYHCARCPLS